MRCTLILLSIAAIGTAACSSQPTQDDPPPVDDTPPPADTPPTDTPPPTDPPPDPPADPPPVEAKGPVRYSGRTVVATKVERDSIRCKGVTEGATLDENRRGCVADLMSQVKDPSHVVVVIDEQTGAGCATCVSMLAEVSPTSGEVPGVVLFAKETAGTVECSENDPKKSAEDIQKSCYATLAKQGASIRAGIVLPMAIEQGMPGCKNCLSIAGTGYTATVLP